jgi:hypothetical protein
MTIADRVSDMDTSLFRPIESQTTEPDRRSLLALHAAIAERGPFDYLEIGSHLGGSLQAMVADPRCRSIVSIDRHATSVAARRSWRRCLLPSEQHQTHAGAARFTPRRRPRED